MSKGIGSSIVIIAKENRDKVALPTIHYGQSDCFLNHVNAKDVYHQKRDCETGTYC